MKMRLSGRLAVLAASSLVAVAGLLALGVGPASARTAPAQAAPAVSVVPNVGAPTCPGSTFCMWLDLNYGNNGNDTHWFYPYSNATANQWHYVGDSANDKASSIYGNRAWTTAYAVDFPVHTSGGSPTQWACLLGGHGIANLGNQEWLNHADMNDSISAYYFWTSSGHGGCPQTF
jgi:hypothetical protein